MLARALDEPTRRGRWTFELDLAAFARTGGMMRAESAAEEPARPSR
jgi:hypothetical protein